MVGGNDMKPIPILTLILAAGLIMPVAGAGAAELRVGFTQDPLTLDPANHSRRETRPSFAT
jgi:hypothetical protein